MTEEKAVEPGNYIFKNLQEVNHSLHIGTVFVTTGSMQLLPQLRQLDVHCEAAELSISLGYDVFVVRGNPSISCFGDHGRASSARSWAFFVECSHALQALRTVEECLVRKVLPPGMPEIDAMTTFGQRKALVQDHPAAQVHLHSVGPRKIAVIKEIRAATDLGLKESKEICDDVSRGTWRLVKKCASTTEATILQQKLVKVGAHALVASSVEEGE